MKLPYLIILSLFAAGACSTSQTAKSKTQNPNHDYRIKTAAGHCLQHNTTAHTLSAAHCAKHKTQYFAVSGNDIRTNGQCLQANTHKTGKGKGKAKNGKKFTVTTAPCTGKSNQSWYREGQTIRSSLNGLCLDIPAKSNTLGLLRCNNSQTQQFTFSH